MTARVIPLPGVELAGKPRRPRRGGKRTTRLEPVSQSYFIEETRVPPDFSDDPNPPGRHSIAQEFEMLAVFTRALAHHYDRLAKIFR